MYQYEAYIERVIDGDTVVAVVDVGFNLSIKKHLRLMDIDTPERGEPGFAESTDFLRAYEGSILRIKTEKADSFGRYLCWLFDDEICLNELLLESGLAKKWTK